MRARLTAQPLFDNKLHKNEQLWDDIILSFMEKFPDQSSCSKQSIKDQFNIPQKMFRDYCKMLNTFRSGQVSGLGRDEQETVLANKKSALHTVFEEFSQESRPMSMPPTLFNCGNAEALAQKIVVETKAALNTDNEDGDEEEFAVQCGQGSGVCNTPLSTAGSSSSASTGDDDTTSQHATEHKRKLEMSTESTEEDIKAAGEFPLHSGARL